MDQDNSEGSIVVYVSGDSTADRLRVVDALNAAGISAEPADPQSVDSNDTGIIIFLTGSRSDAAWMVIEALPSDTRASRVIVLGPSDEDGWRRYAHSVEVAAVLSSDAPTGDLCSLVRLVSHFDALRKENDLIRSESERICFSLVESFGTASERLQSTAGQVEKLEDDLRRIRSNIIKVFT